MNHSNTTTCRNIHKPKQARKTVRTTLQSTGHSMDNKTPWCTCGAVECFCVKFKLYFTLHCFLSLHNWYCTMVTNQVQKNIQNGTLLHNSFFKKKHDTKNNDNNKKHHKERFHKSFMQFVQKKKKKRKKKVIPINMAECITYEQIKACKVSLFHGYSPTHEVKPMGAYQNVAIGINFQQITMQCIKYQASVKSKI